jgi:pSer/pThr/pTyr-binding forkhead associated (FHA) protein
MIAVPTTPSPSEPEFRRGGSLIPIDAAGNQFGDVIPLLRSNLLIGRRESCDIVLRFPNVSAHHCRLWFHEGHWYVEDFNTRNGTRVNGVKIHSPVPINDGDTLGVAKHCFLLRYSA